jgi:NAD-dependent dihydropyrimidine dehydrogenase PreA subunit
VVKILNTASSSFPPAGLIKSIDLEKCNGCGICADVCPMNVISMEEGKPTISYPEDCMTCYNCEAECPNHCVYVEPFRKPIKPIVPFCGAV